MAAAETNEELAKLYAKLAATEDKHAAFWEEKLTQAGAKIPAVKISFKNRLFAMAARRFGPSSIIPALANIETEAATGYDDQTDAEKGMSDEERSHARIFNTLSGKGKGMNGMSVAQFEGKHKGGAGNALRAGVLGANDGLVSVFNLVMGVAGAGVRNSQILLTGIAGLLAGALSMALGEWLSVQSSRELSQHQIDIEKSELEMAPEGEEEELALIYQAKGIDETTARTMAKQIIESKDGALDTLTREELGINPEDLGGSAWEAAYTSFFLFSIGAIIPVLPYIFLSGTVGIIVSSAASAVGLFAIGAAITMMTGKHPIKNGLRQVIFGLATAAVTFGIGKLIGVSIS
jgi:VIT1/CCC1 family predicted Fe2+/Mn2+ transporter